MFVSLDRRASLAGLRVYDTAKPQGWLDSVTAHYVGDTGADRLTVYDAVRTGVVWGYDGSIFGEPVALTQAAHVILQHVDVPHLNLSAAARPWGEA